MTLAVAVYALQLSALRFHPLAVYNAAEVAIQEKPQMFLLMRFGWGWQKTAAAEIQAGKSGENWTESDTSPCACLCHAALQSG